ncbi:MAG: serine/threonine-protein kinase [Polyangiales bacterium]
MTTDTELRAGDLVAGQFVIREKLAAGGMGTLYLADQLVVERPVAIKVMQHALFEREPEALERFKREARVLAQIQHPNITHLYTAGQTQHGTPFLAMEYVQGHTLADELKRGALVLPRVLQIVSQVVQALAAVHHKGVIHRDLKPANIMLTDTPAGPRVKVVDFGIAKALDGPPHLTLTGAFFGTPKYVAPEQARTQKVDARTDVYAVGLVLYEMLTGKGPFPADSAFELLTQQISMTPEPPSQKRMGVTPSLDKLVLRCLEKDPALRYQSADELAEGLAHVFIPRTRPDPSSQGDATLPPPLAAITPQLQSALGVLKDVQSQLVDGLNSPRALFALRIALVLAGVATIWAALTGLHDLYDRLSSKAGADSYVSMLATRDESREAQHRLASAVSRFT